MSLLRQPKVKSVGSAWDRLWDSFSGEKRSLGDRKHRRLRVDPLEERTLLSVSVSDLAASLVASSGSNSTILQVATASDKDGDTIVVWSQLDQVLNEDGTPVIDAETGAAQTDANIYARYLTNEVQQITLPESVLADILAGKYATLSLTYGGNEVQQLTIATATISGDTAEASPVTGTFRLNYTVGGTTYTTDDIEFDEPTFADADWSTTLSANLNSTSSTVNVASSFGLSASLDTNDSLTLLVGEEQMLITNIGFGQFTVDRGVNGTTAVAHAKGSLVTLVSTTSNASRIQAALRQLGEDNGIAALTDVTVTALDSRNFAIAFGDNSLGANQNQLFASDAVWETGWLPAATISTVSEPITISGIKISPTSAALTALSIQDAFNQLAATYTTATVDNADMPTDMGLTEVVAKIPKVKVTAVDLLTYNIEFIGDTALDNVPTLTIASLKDENGVVIDVAEVSVVTLKESSDKFRVNPEELDNPFTVAVEKYNQYSPSVAIDADGDFVIAWESVVPDSQSDGSKTDIFARLYTTVGVVDASAAGIMVVDMNRDGVPETPIQGVRLVEVASPYSATLSSSDPLKVEDDVYTFRANSITTNAQSAPAVGMDADGNFVIAWQSEGQAVSYYNDIRARQFNADGTAETAVEYQVNTTTTNVYTNAGVTMSDDGHYLVTWERGPSIYGELYDATGSVIREEWLIVAGTAQAPAYNASAAFDSANNYAVCWTKDAADADNDGQTSTGVYYTLYDIAGATLIAATRVNGSDGANAYWPGLQQNGIVALDADGDITVVYDGFGPDTSQTVSLANAYFVDQLALAENEDLLDQWPDLEDLTLPFGFRNSGDIDSAIEEVLATAQAQQGFTDEQLGRLNAMLNNVAGILRGEANGVMFSQYDASATTSAQLSSDNVVNSTRDGVNTRILVSVPRIAASGTFTVEVINVTTGLDVVVEITPVFTGGDPAVVDPIGTRDAIETALQEVLGVNWPEADNFQGTVIIRMISAAEVALKNGTHWELNVNTAQDYVYEVTFVGEAHDSPILVFLQGSDLADADDNPVFPDVSTECLGDAGTIQTVAGLGLTAEGNFVVTYVEYNVDSAGSITGENIYYRTFTESTNTAGPTVTAVETGTGQSLADGSVTVEDPVAYVVVTVSEQMYSDLTHAGNDVTNKDNYVLYDSTGKVIKGGINAVYYGLSEASVLAADGVAGLDETPSGKYEIVIAVDGNGTAAGVTSLGTGAYTLKLLSPVGQTTTDPDGTSGLSDASHRGLGATGYVTTVNGSSVVNNGKDFALTFTLNVTGDTGTRVGAEIPVNETTPDVQTTSSTESEDLQFNSRCVATDNDGDYVVVWISLGDQDGDGAGVYMRLFNAQGNALTGETLVNTFTAGDQTSCSVAMDADGDFVVVWASQAQDADGSWGIYGQRFDSMARKVGGEFHVNTNIIGDQIDPSVAIDQNGNFVVVWTSTERAGSEFFNTVRAQAYDSDGVKISAELRINDATMTDVSEAHPQVALADNGNFLVVWSSPTTITNGILLDTQVQGRFFDIYGALTAEFTVSAGGAGGSTTETLRSATNAQVAANRAAGTFIVTWQSYVSAAAGYDVFFSMFDATGNATVSARQANLAAPAGNNAALYSGDQVNPSVSIDANGEFAITWNGNGAETNPLNSADITSVANADSQGVWIRRYSTSGTAIDTQRRVNLTAVGYQGLSSIAMTASGDYVVAWYGRGSGDKQGIFSRVYNQASDMVGPTITDFLLPDGTPVDASGQVTQELYAVIVTFDEALNPATATNVNNYALLIDGVVVVGGINQAYYGLDVAYSLNGQYGINTVLTNKYQVVLIVDANGASPGVKGLTDGQYQILVKNNVRDAAGNPLNSTGSSVNGGVISDIIYVKVPTGQETCVANQHDDAVGGQHTYDSTADAVASDADGDYVIVWTDTTGTSDAGVWARLYDMTIVVNADGTRTTGVAPTRTIHVSSNPTSTDISVAMDADGDFVVTWSAESATTSWDVYAQRFDADGTAASGIFMVNTHTASVQRDSAVAMDVDGDFVITWQSLDQDGSGYGIYAQRYAPDGSLVAGTDEVQQLAFNSNFTGKFRISWDDDGNAATPDKVTSQITYSGNAFAVAAAVETALKAIGADVTVEATSLTALKITFQNSDGAKNQSLVWVSASNVTATTGDPAAAVSTKTLTDGATGEFLVNDTTDGNQMYADVAMADDGAFVVTWTSYGQDGDAATDGNIYAKQFAPYAATATTTSNFNITLVFGVGLTASQQAIFYEAAARWEAIIIGDVPDVVTADGLHIDDILVTVSGIYIDGEGGALGQGGPDEFRDITFLPYSGVIELDTADMASVEAEGLLLDVATHELGHVLGFGTIWTDLNLLTGAGTADPLFIGAGAIAEYNDAFGLNATGVPVENTGGPGTADAHWRESVFGAELMTGYANPGKNYLSRITAASMADIGYEANLNAADGGSEFLVNADDVLNAAGDYFDNQSGDQSHSSVALDADGDFVVVWTGYGQDFIGNGYGPGAEGENGVFARRYTSGGAIASDVFQVNDTAEGDQQDATVAMDADGDFVITWESNINGTDYDIYARFYVNTEAAEYSAGVYAAYPLYMVSLNPLYGMNGEMGGEIRVNTTTNGDQRFPSVSMDDTGDAVVVWSGNGEVAGQDDNQGVFFQRFAKATDDAGPIVSEVQSATTGGSVDVVYDGVTDIDAAVSKFVVTFSENVTNADVTNINNWSLTLDGAVLAGAIAKVQYGLNMAYTLGLTSTPSGNYEAVVTFDSSSMDAGYQSLGKGTYKLTLNDAVEDLSGIALDGNYDGKAGDDFTITFDILGGTGTGTGGDGDTDPTNPTDPGDGSTDTDVTPDSAAGVQDSVAVASDADGNYVIVWVQYDEDVDTGLASAEIYAQLFDADGTKASEVFLVNTYTTGKQIDPDVAMDDYGNFVIVWSGAATADQTGIHATVYDKFGTVVKSDILINETVASSQTEPSVAMDSDGDFVVTWTGYLAGDGDVGVFGRRFNVQGLATSGEFLVNTTIANRQDHSDVAMDDAGNFVVVWESDQQDGNLDGIYGQRFSAAGAKLGSEFQVNTYTLNGQIEPAVAMDADGDFVVTWSSFGQDGSGYGVYARRYNSSGVAKTASEFRVNTTTLNWQVTPDVSMSDAGMFTITWSSYGQDNLKAAVPTYDYGIYARIFNADGTSYRNAATGNATGEFRINAVTRGNQVAPAVTVADNGHIVIGWVGPAQTPATGVADDTDIYSRIIIPGSEAATLSVSSVGPTIGSIVVVESGTQPRDGTLTNAEKLTITWNVADADGVANASIAIDGITASKIYGPYAAASGVNYAASIGQFAAGTHTYIITAVDKLGNVSTYTGTFTVEASAAGVGPTLGHVAIVESGTQPRDGTLTTAEKITISWNALDADGLASSSIAIDGTTVSKVYGPYTAASGVNYAASIGQFAAGTHTYVITATDKAGNVSSITGTFDVVAVAAGVGPTISGVVVVESGTQPKNGTLTTAEKVTISWNALDTDGVASASIKLDGATISKVYGPYAAASGVNYSASLGTLTAGTHTYVITAVDTHGNVSTKIGTFNVVAASSSSNSSYLKSAVFASMASSDTSAKVAWLYDLDATNDDDTSADAFDAVLAGA